jgi:predicted esterase
MLDALLPWEFSPATLTVVLLAALQTHWDYYAGHMFFVHRLQHFAEASPGAAPAWRSAGQHSDAVFSEYSPLFGNAEIVRRLLSPLAQAQIHMRLTHTHEALSPYPLDLSKERFIVYVPSRAPPPQGFGLLVFVPPWEEASVPPGWAPVLDEDAVIFVSAAHSGNSENLLGRRVPLALAAAANIAAQFPIDAQRIYIGGFSGGSRAALRIALGYPDLFRGAILNAGSDPIGSDRYPLPPRDLFLRFQTSMHLIYATGDRDRLNLSTDGTSLGSMARWCVSDVDIDTSNAGHDVLDSAALRRALARLMNHAPSDPDRLAACRSRVQAALDAKLTQADSLISPAKRAAARRLLLQIDAQFGGVAAPRSIELAQRCGCSLIQP